jgi:hypothetical protein
VDAPVDTDTQTDTDAPADTDIPTGTDATADTDADADAGVAEAPVPAPEAEEPPPPEVTVEAPVIPEEPPPKLMYAKGDMETSLSFSLSGDGNVNYLGFSAKFAYYLMDRLAPGIDFRYTNIIGEDAVPYSYPDTITLLPFLKFVLSRKQVAPYILGEGGYEWQWGGNSAANAWILGLGAGVNVAVSKHVLINIELTALHYWYTKKKVYWYKDDDLLSVEGNGSAKINKSDCKGEGCGPLTGNAEDVAEGEVVLVDSDKKQYLCTDDKICGADATFKDKKDVDREWFFPQISVGIAIVF